MSASQALAMRKVPQVMPHTSTCALAHLAFCVWCIHQRDSTLEHIHIHLCNGCSHRMQCRLHHGDAHVRFVSMHATCTTFARKIA